MRGQYTTLTIARDTAWQLSDDSYPADWAPYVDEDRLAAELALCMAEVNRLRVEEGALERHEAETRRRLANGA